MLAGVAERLEFDSELLDDLKTAVSEACNNVVLHAYGDEQGPLLVGLLARDGGVNVMVRDHGGGIQQVAPSDDRMGVGLAVISALADRAEFVSVPDGGTEVRMSFRAGVLSEERHEHGTTQLLERPEEIDLGRGPGDLSGDVVATVAPIALVTGVLGRLARALAAGARFSLDRFSDLYLVTDAIAAHAEGAATDDEVYFAIVAGERRLQLVVGRFRSGSTAQLQGATEGDRRESPLALLADELQVEPATGGTEMLRVVLIDHRRSANPMH
jgi:anti-sigma regulatory factor (Ser/Thr protein kinase)